MVSAVQGITSRIFYVAPFDLGEMIVLGVTFGRFCSAPGKLSLPIPARYLAANSDTFENTLALWDASASARICVKLTRVPRSADTALESGTEEFLEIFRLRKSQLTSTLSSHIPSIAKIATAKKLHITTSVIGGHYCCSSVSTD
jgi:hypothetical protein